LGGRGRQISEFKASLVYKVSSRTARAIQRNPVSNPPPIKKKKKKKNGPIDSYGGVGGGRVKGPEGDRTTESINLDPWELSV
jgi:hypothetical protein